MFKYKVSIIVPFYNASIFLEGCVISLMNQSLCDMEYIFVNDGSTDNSLTILNKVISNFPDRINNIKIINLEKNQGSAISRNRALKEVEGEYVAWVDADDWVEEGMYQRLYECAIETSSDIVYCDFYLDEGNDSVIIKQFYNSDKIELINNMLPGILKGALWNKLIKHSLYKEYNIGFIPNADMGEDLQALVKLYYFSSKISYLPLAHYHWVRNNNSIIAKVFGSPTINYGWVTNIKEIDLFINKYRLFNVVESLNILKLRSKNKLIAHASSIADYKKWLSIFPEVNKISYKGREYPFYLKPVLWCICRNVWIIPSIWLRVRKLYK